VQTRRLAAFFEQVSAAFGTELRSCKATCDLVVLAQKSLKQAGCQSVKGITHAKMANLDTKTDSNRFLTIKQ